MKQKSLMSFFGKAAGNQDANAKPKPTPNAKPTATPKSSRRAVRENIPSEDALSSPIKDVQTPLAKGSSQSSGIVSATYTRSSEGGSSAHETPPTSDPIDVDMISDGDELDVAQSSASKAVCIKC